MSEYSQGICQDGAAILKDGQMLTIEDILEELRENAELKEHFELAMEVLEVLGSDCVIYHSAEGTYDKLSEFTKSLKEGE